MALAPAPPAAPPRRKPNTLLMERRERGLNLAIADAQFTGTAPPRERHVQPFSMQLSPPLPSPTGAMGPMVPAMCRIAHFLRRRLFSPLTVLS